MTPESAELSEDEVWSGEDGCTTAVLECVFSWLSGRELSRAGAVCRAWRRAAAASWLWRRLLRTRCNAELSALRALARHVADGELDPEWTWREEYVRAAAGWTRVGALRPSVDGGRSASRPGEDPGDTDPGGGRERSTCGAILLHAALNANEDILAVAADDATVTVWTRGSSASVWYSKWHCSMRRRGWRSAARVQWAPAPAPDEGERLLVAGPLALAQRWELLVLELSADCEGGRVLSRAGCSAGAAGCWASRDAFLSVELRLLAPRRGVTTFWLNAATQEAQSEFPGVSAPVLRVYNEAQAHLSHVIASEEPLEEESPTEPGVDARYLRTMLSGRGKTSGRVVVAACGVEGGASGTATALGCWRLSALHVPAVAAARGGGLAERALRRRHVLRAAEPEPPPPSEGELRALCEPPAALLPLHARVLGLSLHPGGRCVWATDVSGHVTCAALPTLGVLRVLQAAAADPDVSPHYVHAAASPLLLVSPMGGDSSVVSVWSALSGAAVSPPPRAAAPPPAALLPAAAPGGPPTLLLLAGDAVQAAATHWSSRDHRDQSPLNTHTGMALHRSLAGLVRLALSPVRVPRTSVARASSSVRESCDAPPPPPCPPCAPPPRPACRARPPAAVLARRVTCCPPPAGRRPPCAPAPPACALTCSNATPAKVVTESLGAEAGCGDEQDRVAQRLAAAECARRADYLREVRERRPAPLPETEPFRLTGTAQCARATDGRKYALAGAAPPRASCGPRRQPPAPCCVQLVPDTDCKIRDTRHVDPCAHHPRVIVDIDRSPRVDSSATTAPAPEQPAASNPGAPCAQNKPRIDSFSKAAGQSPAASKSGLTSRIMKSFNLGRGQAEKKTNAPAKKNTNAPTEKIINAPTGKKARADVTVAKSGSVLATSKYAGDTSWCESLKKPPTGPTRCRPPSAMERLRRRTARDLPFKPPSRRLHTTATRATGCSSKDKGIKDSDGNRLAAALRERAGLKEAARGRVVNVMEQCGGKSASAGLELPVPAGAGTVRVNVSVDSARSRRSPTPTCASPSRAPTKKPKSSKPVKNSSTETAAAKLKSIPVHSIPPAARARASTCSRAVSAEDRNDSWLSIKNLQKKIAETCKKSNSSAPNKKSGFQPSKPSLAALLKKPSTPTSSKPPASPPSKSSASPPTKTCAPPPKKPSTPPPSKSQCALPAPPTKSPFKCPPSPLLKPPMCPPPASSTKKPADPCKKPEPPKKKPTCYSPVAVLLSTV